MNAPTSIHPAGSRPSVVPCEDGKMEGLARHVSADGCQLVLAGKIPAVGQQFSFTLGLEVTITGSIRWVVGNRAGFAFDQPLDAATALGLSAHLTQFKTLELLARPEPLSVG